jgi:hypothetical protein
VRLMLPSGRWEQATAAGWGAASRVTPNSTTPTSRSGVTPATLPVSRRRSSSPSPSIACATPMSLPPDLAAMLSVFADADVHYRVVGGHAVSLHARPASGYEG